MQFLHQDIRMWSRADIVVQGLSPLPLMFECHLGVGSYPGCFTANAAPY